MESFLFFFEAGSIQQLGSRGYIYNFFPQEQEQMAQEDFDPDVDTEEGFGTLETGSESPSCWEAMMTAMLLGEPRPPEALEPVPTMPKMPKPPRAKRMRRQSSPKENRPNLKGSRCVQKIAGGVLRKTLQEARAA